MKLLTIEEYLKLIPFEQGYVTYMQAEHDGSTIPKANPYPTGTHQAKEWAAGNDKAMFDVQDGEE